jgi:nucleoid-associated protein YgaU
MKIPTIILATILLAAGCEKKPATEKDGPEKAERLAKLGEFKPAIRAYEAALDGTAKTADIHYKIALLYDDKLKIPLSAIHHYDRYIDLSPSGSHVADARNARRECEKEYHASIAREGFMTQSQAAALRRANEYLTSENARFTKLLDDNKIPYKRVPQKINYEELAARGNLPAGTREHKVKSGDTLANIARTYYKNAALADHIKDANFNQLKGTDKLSIGQVLIIPEAPRR